MAAKIKKGLREMRRSENLFCLSFLILFLVQWAIFWVYANINSIEVAFMHYDVTTDKHIFYNGAHLFDNFKRVFQDIGGASGAYVLNGVIMHLLSTIVCLPVSYMIAYILYKKLPGSGFFQTVLYLPVILSVMITVLLFKQIVEGVVQETLLADVLNGGQTLTPEKVDEILPQLQAIFGKLGYMETSSSDLFSQFLRMGVGATPIAAGYESQIIEYAMLHPDEYEAVRDDIVVLYPAPTVWSAHVLIALDDAGKTLIRGLQDEGVQKLA